MRFCGAFLAALDALQLLKLGDSPAKSGERRGAASARAERRPALGWNAASVCRCGAALRGSCEGTTLQPKPREAFRDGGGIGPQAGRGTATRRAGREVLAAAAPAGIQGAGGRPSRAQRALPLGPC